MQFMYQGEWVCAEIQEDGSVVLINQDGKEVWVGPKDELRQVADVIKLRTNVKLAFDGSN